MFLAISLPPQGLFASLLLLMLSGREFLWRFECRFVNPLALGLVPRQFRTAAPGFCSSCQL